MKIKIAKKKQKPKKKNHIIVENTILKNPFFPSNGWNENELSLFRQYRFWFGSVLTYPHYHLPQFKSFMKKLKKIEKKHGKIVLFCNCRGKYCISKVIKEKLENYENKKKTKKKK